jgi:hypothetical protein
MPDPEALVTIEIKEIRDVPGSVIGRPHVYALVFIGQRRLGRSRKITASGTFDLSAEPEPWRLEIPVRAGQSIPLRVELWDDRGHEAPVKLASASGAVKAPWPSGEVEIGSGPKLFVKVETLRGQFTTDVARARRSPSLNDPSATIRLRRAVTLEITEILGLYKPGHDPGPIAGRPRRLAEYSAGYISEDHKGRIYINSDLDGNWAFNKQLIQLTAKVTPHGAKLPSGTKVKWTLIDPDDPTNDDPDFHQQWGRYVDPDDYDSAGTHTGARGKDNVRAYDEAGTGSLGKIFDKLPPWEGVPGFALSGPTNTEAKTTIDAGSRESKVKLHCPDVGGTNLLVRAELDPPLPTVPVIPAQTGIMTMWKRIDVEVVRMDGAFSLDALVKGIPAFYEPACVQMDFHPERVLAATAQESPDNMAPNDDLESERSEAWVRRVFTNRRKPGWFFLGSAKRASPPPPGSGGSPLFDSNDVGSTYSVGRESSWEYVDINTALPSGSRAAAVQFTWNLTQGSTTKELEVFFSVWRQGVSGSSTRLHLIGHDITSRFTGHDSDGSIVHAHKTEVQFYMQGAHEEASRSWSGVGYDMPASARCVVLPGEPGETSGISPSVKAGGKEFFAGRTIVFSHHPGSADHSTSPPTERPRFRARVPRVITHEFAHAFGMPHKCGQWDHRTPREKSCCMNYFSHLLLVPGRHDRLDPFTHDGKELTIDKMGPRLCGRHTMEIRRVHLERNKGLKWK